MRLRHSKGGGKGTGRTVGAGGIVHDHEHGEVYPSKKRRKPRQPPTKLELLKGDAQRIGSRLALMALLAGGGAHYGAHHPEKVKAFEGKAGKAIERGWIKTMHGLEKAGRYLSPSYSPEKPLMKPFPHDVKMKPPNAKAVQGSSARRSNPQTVKKPTPQKKPVKIVPKKR